MLRVWIGGWRHVEQTDPTKAHTGKTQTDAQIVKIPFQMTENKRVEL